ncbi:MAG: hypothetical protein JSU03_12220 [Bacteroidetes bacterium]|nr:hypothetical protein [Bacteroidota bacterium]MBS1758035.1 hypothetical protein [Bacteroidota bacterium]
MEAANLFSGKGISVASNYMYFTEALLIFLAMKIHAGYGAVIAFQLILNFVALIYLYRFMIIFYSSRILAFAGCFLLIVCFPYQLYNASLYTESVFFSLSILYSCYLLKLKKLSLKSIVVLIIFLILLCISRPSGIFFLGATIIYLFFFVSKKLNPFIRIAVFVSLSFIALWLLNYLMGTGGSIDVILPFKEQMVICEVPTIHYTSDTGAIQNDNSIAGLANYIFHNFHQFGRLTLLKSKAFFGLLRPYYSSGHNAFLLFYFYPLYLFIILCIIKMKYRMPVAFIYFIILIIIFWLSVVFSCDEWHNRFFLTLVPFLILPALYLFKKHSKVFNKDGS